MRVWATHSSCRSGTTCWRSPSSSRSSVKRRFSSLSVPVPPVVFFLIQRCFQSACVRINVGSLLSSDRQGWFWLHEIQPETCTARRQHGAQSPTRRANTARRCSRLVAPPTTFYALRTHTWLHAYTSQRRYVGVVVGTKKATGREVRSNARRSDT